MTYILFYNINIEKRIYVVKFHVKSMFKERQLIELSYYKLFFMIEERMIFHPFFRILLSKMLMA